MWRIDLINHWRHRCCGTCGSGCGKDDFDTFPWPHVRHNSKNWCLIYVMRQFWEEYGAKVDMLLLLFVLRFIWRMDTKISKATRRGFAHAPCEMVAIICSQVLSPLTTRWVSLSSASVRFWWLPWKRRFNNSLRSSSVITPYLERVSCWIRRVKWSGKIVMIMILWVIGADVSSGFNPL